MRLPVRTLLSLLIPAASTALAGTVEVSFVNPASYSDAGITQWDEKANLQALATHLERLGQRQLAANQMLKLEVLDVDLAGTVRPALRSGGDVRVLRGAADYPRIHLRYTLQADGAAVRSGDEWLKDLDYSRGLAGRYRAEPLYYEKRMLDDWFKVRFGASGAGAY